VRCNQRIKFSLLADRCMEKIPFDRFATGHYARVEQDKETGRYLLKRARSIEKDQSYFLSQLSQDQLKRIMFPLGELSKQEVRRIAARFGLHTAEKEESQDFFAGDYTELFSEKQKPGNIVDAERNVLGRHKGIISYTIGQRKGLGISAPHPLYVISIDAERNEIVVGPKEALRRSSLTADQFNWISRTAPEPGEDPVPVTAKIRHGTKEYPASVQSIDETTVRVMFEQELEAVTPGQAAVLYQEDTVVGGGFILNAE
jgi:tRNA-specific 2-thiouridylase